MLPDQSHNQANTPPAAALPPVQSPPQQQPASLPAASLQPATMPAAGMDMSAAQSQPITPVDQLKTLAGQYGTNPYAFNAAFQQLKAQYLAERYHIVPSAERN
jgi:hypothetical protein